MTWEIHHLLGSASHSVTNESGVLKIASDAYLSAAILTL